MHTWNNADYATSQNNHADTTQQQQSEPDYESFFHMLLHQVLSTPPTSPFPSSYKKTTLQQLCRAEDKKAIVHQWAAATQRHHRRTMKPIAVSHFELQNDMNVDLVRTEMDEDLTTTTTTTIVPRQVTPTPTVNGPSGTDRHHLLGTFPMIAVAALRGRLGDQVNEHQPFLTDGFPLTPTTIRAWCMESTCHDRYLPMRGHVRMASPARIRST